MELANKTYFGFYCFLENQLENELCQNKGDNISVGQEISIKIDTYLNDYMKELPRARVYNLADELVGFLPKNKATQLQQAEQDGFKIRVCVSAVTYDEGIEEYMAQVAVIAYLPNNTNFFDALCTKMFENIAGGDHVKIQLSEKELQAILNTPVDKIKLETIAFPKLEKGKAYYKKHATGTEKMVIAASQNKIGCWIGSFAVFAVVGAAIIFIVLKIMGIV
ncbi:MAG: hypothetical protein MJ189_00065 [Coriobacteriales bacterium]|nr:hypothetical protein [Coriobacteriales bacterium]